MLFYNDFCIIFHVINQFHYYSKQITLGKGKEIIVYRKKDGRLLIIYVLQICKLFINKSYLLKFLLEFNVCELLSIGT